MVENTVGVNKKQWRKWNDLERQCFIDLYESMMESPELYSPTAFGYYLSHEYWYEQWQTIAWNAAFMAADLMRYNRKFNG